MAKVAVLIPCYNEEKTIGKVVADYKAALPEADIYVYNNNSTDRTAEIAEKAGAIVRSEYRQGKGNVVRSMFRQIDADCYLMIDGDDTYPAENAREMVEYVLSGQADMVIGDRLSSTYFTENKRPFHNMGNVLVRRLFNWLFHSNINDIMTGYRAFSKAFVKGFPVLSRGFEIETEMSKLNTYSDGFRVLKTIFRLFREYRPLAFFSAFALLFLLITLILFLPVFVDYLRTGLVDRVPTLVVSGVFGTCSLVSFLVGVILDVVVKKDRQMYEILMNLRAELQDK